MATVFYCKISFIFDSKWLKNLPAFILSPALKGVLQSYLSVVSLHFAFVYVIVSSYTVVQIFREDLEEPQKLLRKQSIQHNSLRKV